MACIEGTVKLNETNKLLCEGLTDFLEAFLQLVDFCMSKYALMLPKTRPSLDDFFLILTFSICRHNHSSHIRGELKIKACLY